MSAKDFEALYRREMVGSDNLFVYSRYLYWVLFITAIKNQFLLLLEAQKLKIQIDAERNSRDIENNIVKIKKS
jgi:hypothetical protein